ncbi:hypothetical protein AX17_004274 [Amanita inopinata Kibby_2008]|nr:hypothetical protein AX17_004274 [Amanita inopinata Kibby_2008]
MSSSATGCRPASTPHMFKAVVEAPFTSHHVMRDPRMSRLGAETTGYVVGPVPVKDFLKLYVPGDAEIKKNQPKFDREGAKQLKTLLESVNEESMYKPWVESMTRYSPKFKIHDVHSRKLLEFCNINIKPDIVLCPHPPKEKTVNQDASKTENQASKTNDKPEKIDVSKIELFAEFKANRTDDPFVDIDPQTVEAGNNQARDTLGQLAAYATCHMGVQHRTHVFQILVVGSYARLLRWDRSGVVVTEEIPVKNSALAEFLWCFSHLSDLERGWDTCVTKPSQELMDQAKAKLGESSEYWHVSLGAGRGSYVVGQAKFAATHSPFGRATRFYEGYTVQPVNTQSKTIEPGTVVSLKLTWRVHADTRRPEHETYAILHGEKVEHIPTVVEGTDIEGHVTKTQDADAKWRKPDMKSLRKFQEYILVLEEYGRPLTSFGSTRELLGAISDASIAHQQAYEKTSILHRDISAGNIVITKENRGLLIDWDAAKSVDELKQGGSEPERTDLMTALMTLSRSTMYSRGWSYDSFNMD